MYIKDHLGSTKYPVVTSHYYNKVTGGSIFKNFSKCTGLTNILRPYEKYIFIVDIYLKMTSE